MTLDPWSRKRSLYGTPVIKMDTKPKKTWWITRALWRGLKRLCTAIGAGVLIMMMISLWAFSSIIGELEPKQVALPNQMVLYLELDGKLSEIPSDVSLLDPFARQGVTMRKFVDALDKAAVDPRVKGIYARFEEGGYSIAHIQEMRNAIKRFRANGKFAYIYSTSLAETGGLGSYYLASAFDEIWMQPMGVVSIAGINAEMPFLRGVLDKIGIEPQFFQRKEYKSAYENLTHSNMTPANKEMMNVLIGDIAGTILKDVAQDRKTTPEKFKAFIDQALFTSPEALKAGLIDEAQYADVLVEKINEKVTGDKAALDLPYVNVIDYIAGTEGQNFIVDNALALPQPITEKKEIFGDRPKIAVIYAVGTIMPSKGSAMEEGIAAADDIASALMEAAEDASIDAVVLRIDSPGGSPVASETILRAVEKVKENDKSVIVSMGPTAASGGYWIAAYADRIFVLPSTLTGSIGVLGGKVSAKGLWKNLGVNWEGVKWGENAGLWSINTPFSVKEAERMNAMLDNVYVNFIERVEKGRKLTKAQVEDVARGRVWTGRQAIERNLADQIGGLDAALDYTAMKYGANGRSEAEIIVLPKPLTPIESLVKILEGQAAAGEVLSKMGRVITEIKPVLDDVVTIKNTQGVKVYEPIRVQ